MRKTAVIAALLLLAAPSAHAEGTMGGLGFRTTASPFAYLKLSQNETQPTVGGRHWFTEQVAVDVGIGYNQDKYEPATETWTGFSFDLGLPILLKKVSDRVLFLLRPGVQWGSLEDKNEYLAPTVTTKYTMIGVSGELEVEWMVADRLSVSAAHGLAWHRLEDDGSPKTTATSFGTSGSNFTSLGFHVYLW